MHYTDLCRPENTAAARSPRHQSRNERRHDLPPKHALRQPRPIAACRPPTFSAGRKLRASSRQKGRRGTPSALPLDPATSPQTPKRDASPQAPHLSPLRRPNATCVSPVSTCVTPMSPFVDPMSTPVSPSNILSREAAQTSCHGEGKNFLKTDDIGRLRYPFDTQPLHGYRPRLKPNGPPTASRPERPVQASKTFRDPAPAVAHSPATPSRGGTELHPLA